MTILVLGAAGNIGRSTVAALSESGHSVVTLTRTKPAPDIVGSKHVIGDRDNAEQVSRVLEKHNVDTIIDFVAFDLPSTEQLLPCIESLVDRYVLISSCDVYKNYGLLRKLETGKPDVKAVDESGALRSSRYPFRVEPQLDSDDPEKRWKDSYDKIPIEQLVQNLSCAWTILRLPMVYGSGDPQHRFKWVVEPMVSGKDRLVVPSAWLDWTTTYGFIDNVAGLVAQASVNESTCNQIFNVSDAEPESNRVWFDRFSNFSQWNGKLEESATTDIEGFKWLNDLNLSAPLSMSGSALTNTLNTDFPVKMDSRIARTFAWESQHLTD